IGWLDGPTAEALIQGGQGERAGELAASWMRRSASLHMRLGRRFGAARMLCRARRWEANLSAADPALGTAAATLTGRLARTLPEGAGARAAGGSRAFRYRRRRRVCCLRFF